MWHVCRIAALVALATTAGCFNLSGIDEDRPQSGGGLSDTTVSSGPPAPVPLNPSVDIIQVLNGKDATSGLWLSGMDVDPSGNLLLNYYFYGTVTVGGVDYTSLGDYDLLLVKRKQDGTVLWARQIGGNSTDYSNALKVDSSGDVYVTVETISPSVDLGGGDTFAITGPRGCAVVKYLGTNGNRAWTRKFTGSNGYEYCYYLDVSSDGKVAVGGSSSSTTLDLGGGVLAIGTSTWLGFIGVYDASNGNHVWSRSNYHSVGASIAEVITVAFDHSGGLVVSGDVYQGTLVTGKPGDTVIASAGGGVMLARYSASNGAHLWTQVYEETGTYTWTTSMMIDSADNVVWTAGYETSMTIGPQTYTSSGAADQLIVKSKVSDGSLVWVKPVSDVGVYDWGLSVTLGPNDSIVIAGSTYGSVDLGLGAMTPASGNGGIYYARLDSSGTPLWQHFLEGPSGGAGAGYEGQEFIRALPGGGYVGQGWFKDTLTYDTTTFPGNGAGNWAAMLVFMSE